MTKLKSSEIIWKENIEKPFVSVPASIFHFIELGLISGNDFLLYTKLIDQYNTELGYAYPTYDQLEVITNSSRDTINKSLAKLEELGLIEKRKGYKGNNVYYVYKPLDKEELYSLLPEKVEKLVQKRIQKNIKGERDKQRLRDWVPPKKEKEIQAIQVIPIGMGE